MDKMPDDLRWLAERVDKFGGCVLRNLIFRDYEESMPDYCMPQGLDENGKFKGYPVFTRDQWQAARQQLAEERMEKADERIEQSIMTESEEKEYGPVEQRSKYHVEIRPGVWVDVYDVLHAFRVTNPGDQHALKKTLMPGKRGVKSANQDRREAILSLERAIELEGGQ